MTIQPDVQRLPRNFSDVLNTGGTNYAESIEWRTSDLQRLIPQAGDWPSVGRVVMVRESLDLLHRETSSCALLVERGVQWTRPLTQCAKKQVIVPAVPGVLQLKEAATKAAALLEQLRDPWTQEDAEPEVFRRVIAAPNFKTFAAGRETLAGAASVGSQFARLLDGIRAMESQWGSFEIWIKNPEQATISALARALVDSDHDAEEFLEQLLGLGYPPEYSSEAAVFLRLKAAIASKLWNEGKGPSCNYQSLEHLKRAIAKRNFPRRVRPIELAGEPVGSLEPDPKGPDLVSVFDDDSELPKVLSWIGAREPDRTYIELRLVDRLPPRKIRKELLGLSKSEFAALQRRCSRRLRKVQKSVLEKISAESPSWQALLGLAVAEDEEIFL